MKLYLPKLLLIAEKTSFQDCSRNEFPGKFFFAVFTNASSHDTTLFALFAKRVLRKRDISSAFETNYQRKYNDTNILDPADFCDTFGLGVAHKSKILFTKGIIKK